MLSTLGRRARGPPTASSSNSGSNHGGTHFADIESQGSNTGFQRKRSLVRRDRAQHHGRTPSGQQAYQGTAHHPHRATLNGMRGNPDGPPGGGGGPNSPVPLPPNISRRPITLPREKDYSRPETACRKAWVVFSKIITFYAVSPLLAACGMPDPHVQQAWREKMALCTIIALLMAALAFLTFAFNAVLCQPSSTRLDSTKIGNGFVIVNGFALDVTNYNHNFQSSANNNFGQFPFWEMYGESQSRQNRDLSFMFQNQYAGLPECVSLFGPQYIRLDEYLFPCTIGAVAEDKGARKFGKYPASYCHKDTALLRSDVSDFTAKGKRRQLFVPWDQLENTQNDYLAFNGQVIDLSIIYRLKKPVNWSNLNGVNFEQVFKRYKNKDATMFMSSNATMSDAGKCLTKIARVGSLDSSTMGCIASDVVLWVSLLVILSLVLSRFFMAIIFRWVLAPKLGRRLTEEEKRGMLLMRNARERDAGLFGGSSVGGGNGNGNGSIGGTRPGSYMSAVISGTPGDRRSVWSQYDSTQQPPAFTSSPTSSPAPGVGFSDTISTLTGVPVPDSPKTNPVFGNETTSSQRSSNSFDIQRSPRMMPLREPDLTKEEVMHTILLVTCYSEDEHGIRTTLDSLAATHYMDTHKLLFVIADGIIMGAGNEKSTPEIIVSMMEKDPTFPEVPKPYSYVAIADGAKRHNMAAVHAGYYNYEGHRVPMVVVVKCGGPEEKDLPKPGNRGKRDSQIVLMSFLQKVMFDERMTPLEYDLFQKIHKVARVTPDVYEMVLMVDADTKVAPDSVERMVACFARDHTVMGLCGETQIENKFGSWVTMIQVFEYYISHHLAKAFESVFGGVTCLPGCFCAYRIKTPKGEHGRHWVPILANPDIVDQYQENVVETLHEKNLFLLGEDRYLTTLMLKTFPKRKMLFVPQATCETTVPDQFSVLLSQRRRWINSTIHNLMELVLVKDLCGTFCISMQFVIAIELFGTLVLPAAICFTIYLVVISFFSDPVPIIPLLLLAAILGLPGLLIVFTTRKWQFLFWMVIYLLSLPVWNFILPTYAFWHFDDFSWGATRVVQGGKDGHDDDDGEFDSSKIIMKRYAEWEQIKQRAIAQALEAAAHQHQQAYRRAAQAQMQQYYGVDNQLVRSNGLEYTA
ncbi:chitin synthase-domain-containing protein [Catenaria anguillulae PL171]|uniref:chitin synthase n=1 Tax=Catenaria anguillulae PL171 TaxID=765915 RepID=A0A1Y2HWV0_9FUNG|nr:chitin synthase-domain-containing protein [Catenaria anguillulae PL171]